jgi:hypothetical protein
VCLKLYTTSLGDGDKEEQRINDFGDRERIKRTMTCCLFFLKKIVGLHGEERNL